jgi:hypothetical protein
MMVRRWLATALWTLAVGASAGCVDSCSCGAGEVDEAAATPGVTAVTASGAGQPATDSGVASYVAGPQAPSLKPLPEGELRTELEQLSADIDWEHPLGDAVGHPKLRRVLGTKVGVFKASADVLETTPEIDGARVTPLQRLPCARVLPIVCFS